MPRDLFPMLEPPAGGLVRLRARVRSDQRRAARLPRWALAASAAAVLIAVPFLRPEPAVLDLSSTPTAIKLGLVAAPAAAVAVPKNARNDVTVAPMQSTSDDVIYYWVASTRPSRFHNVSMVPSDTSSP